MKGHVCMPECTALPIVVYIVGVTGDQWVCSVGTDRLVSMWSYSHPTLI